MGTSSGTRLALDASSSATGSARWAAGCHPAWLSRGARLRAERPSSWRSRTVRREPGWPAWTSAAVAATAALAVAPKSAGQSAIGGILRPAVPAGPPQPVPSRPR